MLIDRLGIGCARLGSISGASGADGLELIKVAYDNGIRFFDTASIYGQGESERTLAYLSKTVRDHITIATKAGQFFPGWMRLALPLKRTVAAAVKQSVVGRVLVTKARSQVLPQNFSSQFLSASAEQSLKRLGVECLDILMLHSPPPEIVRQGDAMTSLELLQTAGKVRAIGMSCDDIDCGFLGLQDSRVKVVELPLWPWTEQSDLFLAAAADRNVHVLARGFMGATLAGLAGSSGEERSASLQRAVQSSLSLPGLGHLIVGTTKVTHLKEVLEAARGGNSR